jgi:predicted NBD/HSP70 family sugar kinase
MGTSQAAGYITPAGNLTSWLNELAFAPVDYQADAPRDEWSGDHGCGVQYFSQQAVGRLARGAGFDFDESVGLPERLQELQQAMDRGDPRARAVFETIGSYLGYSLAHYTDFYEVDHLLLLGRVTSGAGGAVLLDRAEEVLAGEFPELRARLRIHLPPEKERRHGQAIAAASLPAIKSGSGAR